MDQEKEKETVKVRTKKGRIITLTISKKTPTHYHGSDKFGELVIISIKEIESLLPVIKWSK